MPPIRVPKPIADRMVELLFEETASTNRKRILYPGCGEGELIAAVERYFEDSINDPPSGVAIDNEAEHVETVRETYGDHVEARQVDYLSADVRLDRFDFVLSYPPTVEWAELSGERRREYANTFARISPESSHIHTGLLFLERSLHVLTGDGKGVFLTTRDFTSDAATGPFRSYLAPKVADIEQIDDSTFEVPHMLLVVNSLDSAAFSPSASANRPDPSEVEAQLLASASPSTIDAPARRIATCFPDLEVYRTTDDAAFVYLDLYYEDYDAALVYDDPDAREGLQGYVSRVGMEIRGQESVGEHTRPLTGSECIDPSEDLGRVIRRLGEDGERFCFVGIPTDPVGVVTRFDLNEIPVYQYLYILLARFEIRLRRLVREHVPDWEETTDVFIAAGNVGDLAPDRLSGGSIGDLLEILSQGAQMHQIPADLESHDADLADLRRLRNAIAHYNPLVHTMSNDTDSEWSARNLRARHELLCDIIDS